MEIILTVLLIPDNITLILLLSTFDILLQVTFCNISDNYKQNK